MIGLVTAHGVFAGLVPRTCGLAVHVVFPDQSFLNCLCPFRFDLLLAARAGLPLAVLSRARVLPLAVVGCHCRIRFWTLIGGRMRGRMSLRRRRRIGSRSGCRSFRVLLGIRGLSAGLLRGRNGASCVRLRKGRLRREPGASDRKHTGRGHPAGHRFHASLWFQRILLKDSPKLASAHYTSKWKLALSSSSIG